MEPTVLHTERRKMSKLLALAVLAITATAILMLATTATAAGVTQVSGTAVPGIDENGYVTPCNAGDDPFLDDGGPGAAYAIAFPEGSGDLEGCIYGGNAVTSAGTPSGVFKEVADELFVGSWGDLNGTFALTENWHAKFGAAGQVFGFCKHPVVKNSGTGDFDGVTGRLDFRDDIAAGDFPYKGHLRVD